MELDLSGKGMADAQAQQQAAEQRQAPAQTPQVAAPTMQGNEGHFQQGQLLFQEGQSSDVAYIILDGEVEIFKHTQQGTVLLAVLGKGEILGEMGLVDGKPRSASAKARTPLRVKLLTHDVIAATASALPQEFLLLVRATMERLREANIRVTDMIAKQSQHKVAAPDELSGEPPKEVRRLTLQGMTDATIAGVGAQGMVLSSLPFRVGALPEGAMANPLDWNNLMLEGADPNLMARNHFTIQLSEHGPIIMDRGSPAGTWVNGEKLGGDSGKHRCALRFGNNVIAAGSEASPYQFALHWE